MPENETLYQETSNASRWCPLRARLSGGESPQAILPDLEENLYLALRRAFKRWKQRGVKPEQLFDAAVNDPSALRELVNRTGNDDFGVRLREVTHRCRPIMIMSVAGMVADSVGAHEVEIFESGVGSVNLPLMSGPNDYRTTRSTHPHYLRLISDLVSHVNDANVRFVLPFAHLTKAEVVRRATELSLGELVCKSVSCILHPLRRPRGRQCGHCPACVYRRQAMISAGIDEGTEAYEVDVFAPRGSRVEIPETQLQTIRAFQQQAARLSELDSGRVPKFFRRFLFATHVVSTDEELASYAEVYRRYSREWSALIADSRRRGLAWIAPARSLSTAQGATA